MGPSLCFQKAFCSHEAHISTEQAQAQSHAWISGPDGQPRRPSYSEAAACKGPRAPDDLRINRTDSPTRSHPYRFSARLKLTRAADFEAVLRDGRRSADHFFTVLYHPSGLKHARLGMTASAKRIRTAVRRNRVRRLIRESFRHAFRRLPGLDIVVVVREPASRAASSDIFKSLEGHWAQLESAAGAHD